MTQIFNLKSLTKHRDQAAANFADYAFLNDQVAHELCEIIHQEKIQADLALDLGSGNGFIAKSLSNITFVESDISLNMLQTNSLNHGRRLVLNPEQLPFQAESFDLVISNLLLHWINDLPGCLTQIRKILRKGGKFIAAILGGKTLFELRKSLIEAEIMLNLPVTPHIIPMIDAADMAALLQRAGFNKPVAHNYTITIRYDTLLSLFRDLKGMGQNSCLVEIGHLSRQLIETAETIYRKKTAANHKLQMCFEIISMYGEA